MAEAGWTVDVSEIDRLSAALEAAGNKSGEIVESYLSEKGFDLITEQIQPLIHASGRKWKGKTASATAAAPTTVFNGTVSGMTIKIASQSRYGYLYFPDDGSNTIHHAGNQNFMLRGAEQASDQMVDDLVERLTTAFMEG